MTFETKPTAKFFLTIAYLPSEPKFFGPPFNLRILDRKDLSNTLIIYRAASLFKPGFYNNCYLRFPCMSALATSVYRLVASGEAPDETVATGCGSDGGGAATGTAERLIFRK